MNVQYKKGVIELCVLSMLARRDCYGYDVSENISQLIDISDGTVYPILRKLKNDGLVRPTCKRRAAAPRASTTSSRSSAASSISPTKTSGSDLSNPSDRCWRRMTMNRIEFLKRLRERLDALAIGDVDEIVSQYEEHFAYKQADGAVPEEVAAKLRSPEQLAAQFATAGEGKRPGGSKALTVLGLVFTDLFAGMFFVVLYAWTAAVAVLSIASAVLGACLLAGFSPYSLIPGLPYEHSTMAGSLIALGVLASSRVPVFRRLCAKARARLRKVPPESARRPRPEGQDRAAGSPAGRSFPAR